MCADLHTSTVRKLGLRVCIVGTQGRNFRTGGVVVSMYSFEYVPTPFTPAGCHQGGTHTHTITVTRTSTHTHTHTHAQGAIKGVPSMWQIQTHTLSLSLLFTHTN